MSSSSPSKRNASPAMHISSPSSSKRSKAYRLFTAACTADKEARIQSAIKALEAGVHTSVTAAAQAHQVSKTTLLDRRKGMTPKKYAHAERQTLPPAAETALANHIKVCAKGGFPLKPADMNRYANHLARQHNGPKSRVGEKWLRNFLIRNPSLKSAYSRCVENARIKAVDANDVKHSSTG